MTRSTPWSRLAALLGVEHPIIQAPMSGGATTPELVAAASNAGGLGSSAVAYLKPEDIVKHSRRVRELTDRPFAINLFAPLPPPAEAAPDRMLAVLAGYHAQLGLAPPQPPAYPLPPSRSRWMPSRRAARASSASPSGCRPRECSRG
ncbi:nitronate monooxygenase [Cystobacter fuscus]